MTTNTTPTPLEQRTTEQLPPGVPPQMTYDPPGPGPWAEQPPPRKKRFRGLAITALVLGIIGAVFALTPITFVVAFPLGILALIFGIFGFRHGMGKAGAILGAVAIVLGIVWSAAWSNAANDGAGANVPPQTTTTAPADPSPPAQEIDEVQPAPETPAAPAETVSQQQAIQSANSYLEMGTGFSRSGLIDQLKFEGFSTADATYAVDAISPDWNEQAVQSAEGYMELGGFSRSGLIDQLKFEGFTQAQAVHAANAVGL